MIVRVNDVSSGGSRSSDEGGGGGGVVSKQRFFSFWSKNKGGGLPGPLPWIRHWLGLLLTLTDVSINVRYSSLESK